MDWSSVVRKDLPAIVNIAVETLSKDPTDGTVHRHGDLGTGFFINGDGLILTNRHVIAGAFRITVTTSDRLQWNAELIAVAKIIDLAVLKIHTDRSTPFLQPADSDAIQVGDPLLVIGNPLGLGTSASAGIVSARNRNLRNTPFDDYIQTDAAINHGNSGGPVLDRNGDVAGIATILVTQAAGQGSSGLGFAIPARDAYQAVTHLLDPTAMPVGWIGVHLQDVTPDLARSFGLPEPRGLLVTQIDPASPAQAAGLQSGDIILSYNGAVPEDSSALMWDIVQSPIGQPASMTIRRQGQVINSSVMVADWPDLQEPVSAVLTSPALAAAARVPDLGLLLTPNGKAAQRLFGLTTTTGVVVAAVNPASEAYASGIVAGDVIEKVQDMPVQSARQLMDLIDNAQHTRRYISLLVTGKAGTRWVSLYAGAGEVSGSAKPQAITPPAAGN